MDESERCMKPGLFPAFSAALLFLVSGVLIALLLSSCNSEASINVDNLARLKEGMSKQEVLAVMGQPLVNEKYNTENVWFYYTESKWSDGSRTSDECSPLVFEDGKLIGWGQAFYKKYVQKSW